jgi:nitrate reductase gamma subunit
MKFIAFILLSAALGIGAIGVGYMLVPDWMYSLYGIGIESVNEANMVRGAYGGLFVASAVLFLLGALQAQFTRPA